MTGLAAALFFSWALSFFCWMRAVRRCDELEAQLSEARELIRSIGNAGLSRATVIVTGGPQ